MCQVAFPSAPLCPFHWKNFKIKLRLFQIIPEISAQYLSWGLRNWFFLIFFFCQSVRLLLTLHLCICFLCIPFFVTVCIFSKKFSLLFILGPLSSIARASFLFYIFISAGKILWYVFIASKNFNSSLNGMCARWPFLQPLFVFLAESSLSHLFLGFFLILQTLPLVSFLTFFIFAGKFLWFVFIASKNFNSSLNEICARWPFLQPPFVLSIGKNFHNQVKATWYYPQNFSTIFLMGAE